MSKVSNTVLISGFVFGILPLNAFSEKEAMCAHENEHNTHALHDKNGRTLMRSKL